MIRILPIHFFFMCLVYGKFNIVIGTPGGQNITTVELQSIIKEEWMSLAMYCEKLDSDIIIKASFDIDLIGSTTLAWMSSTLILNDGTWIPSISNKKYGGHDMLIGVNPHPPNGWHTSSDCVDIGNRYNLRTVIRHELIHGLGLSSSITYNDGGILAGYFFDGMCYPSLYDTKIEDAYGRKIVDRCHVRNILGKKIYLNNVELFNPVTFSEGSSISHHIYPSGLMFWQLPEGKCADIGTNELKMLSAIGIDCPDHPLYSDSHRVGPSHFLNLIMLLLFCF